jgi:hypothetical protein
MRIVFLNLADQDDHGLARSSVNALKQKYKPVSWAKSFLVAQNSVDLYEMFSLFEALKQGALNTPENQEQLRQIQLACKSADKIMLAAHGNYGNTVQVCASPGWDLGVAQVIGDYRQLAYLMRAVLLPGCSYRLALIVCYAARSENYQKDHSDLGGLSAIDIRSSFAFKFFSEICCHCRVQMTARIGAVEFDSVSGSSSVRTEAATSAQIEYDQMQRLDNVEEAQGAYEQVRAQYDDATMTIFDDMEGKFVDARGFKPEGVPDNPEEVILQNYHRLNSRRNELVTTAAKRERKYGKLIYRYIFDKIAVFATYPTEKVIYVGPL